MFNCAESNPDSILKTARKRSRFIGGEIFYKVHKGKHNQKNSDERVE